MVKVIDNPWSIHKAEVSVRGWKTEIWPGRHKVGTGWRYLDYFTWMEQNGTMECFLLLSFPMYKTTVPMWMCAHCPPQLFQGLLSQMTREPYREQTKHNDIFWYFWLPLMVQHMDTLSYIETMEFLALYCLLNFLTLQFWDFIPQCYVPCSECIPARSVVW